MSPIPPIFRPISGRLYKVLIEAGAPIDDAHALSQAIARWQIQRVALNTDQSALYDRWKGAIEQALNLKARN